MGNQVCCAGGNGGDFEHFQQAHHYNRRHRGHSQQRDDAVSDGKPVAAGRGPPTAGRRDRDGRGRAGAVNNQLRSVSPLRPPPDKLRLKQIQDQRMKCLLVDKYSLDFTKPFNPPNKSALALAALENRNGCRISSKQFLSFKSGVGSQSLLPSVVHQPSVASDLPPINYKPIQEQLEEEYQFNIQFLDFSQRRKIGFRGAFEFDDKRILIGNESQIKILAYPQNVDGSQLLKSAETKRKSRSKSPLAPGLSKQNTNGQLTESPSSPNAKRGKSSEPSSGAADSRDPKSKNRDGKGTTKQPKKEGEPSTNQRLASFEIGTFQLPDYPNEKIVFVKFLDDNDPRLLFLVTYSAQLTTTYMKVIKIEKIKPVLISPNPDQGELNDRRTSAASATSRKSFSYFESQPYSNLKKEILEQQMNTTKDKSGNPNAADKNQNGLVNAEGKKQAFRPNENLKGTLITNDVRSADLQITSDGMTKPIKMKTGWDPSSNFEALVLKQIDEMERLEFQQDEGGLDGKQADLTQDEVKQEEMASQIIQKDAAQNAPDLNQKPIRAGHKYELIQSKLGKFKSTELQILYFGNAYSGNQGMGSTSRAKQMISIDQHNIYRVHKVKGIKMMSEKDYSLTNADFPDGQDPKRIINHLKGATYRQLKDVQVVVEYVFCSLLQSSRLNCLDPEHIQTYKGLGAKPPGQFKTQSPDNIEDEKEDQISTVIVKEEVQPQTPRVQVEQVLFYQGLILASLSVAKESQLGTFKKTVIKQFSMLTSEPEAEDGRSLDLNAQYFSYNKKYMSSIDFLKIPRLDWDDRRIEYDMIAEKYGNEGSPTEAGAGPSDFISFAEPINNANQQKLPPKLIVSGQYQNLLKKEDGENSFKSEKQWPYVALVDTQFLGKRSFGAQQDFTMIKCFQSDTESKSSFFKKGTEQTNNKLNLQITALNYGPYDNGHIILGFNNGHILILNSLDLASMFRLQVFEPLPAQIKDNIEAVNLPQEDEYVHISKIQFDPTQMILVSSTIPYTDNRQKSSEILPFERYNLAGITLIENQAQYKYIDMGQQTFMTLVISKDDKKNAKAKNSSPSFEGSWLC